MTDLASVLPAARELARAFVTYDDLARADEAELERRFAAPLSFGTAGLRGPVMAGPAGMNRHTVRRTTQGVVAWLHEIGADTSRGVVVGRDGADGRVGVSCGRRSCASPHAKV